jgi:site-specific DNA recombinase
MKRAAIYSRVSTDRQEQEGVSLDLQERANLEHARQLGYQVEAEHVYRETRSGGDLWQRHGFMQLIAAAEHGEFQAVVVYCLDRLTRELFHLGYIRTILERCGVELIFVTEDYQDTLESDLMLSVRGIFSREERRKISKRTRDALDEMLDQGLVPGQGPAPFGYMKQDGKLFIHEPEACIVRRIFDWAADGNSANAITRLLNAEGILPPSCGEKRYTRKDVERAFPVWWACSVWAILRDSVYRGELWLRRERSTRTERGARGGKSACVSRPREEWRSLAVPAIVSDAVWHSAQSTLDRRRGAARSRNQKRPALLRGAIFCAGCNRPMYPDWDRGTASYRCSSRVTPNGPCGVGQVKAAEIEPWVWDAVAQFLKNPALIEAEVERVSSGGVDTQLAGELESERRALKEIERRQERLLLLFTTGSDSDLPLTLIKKQLSQSEKEKRGHEERIAALERRLHDQAVAQGQIAQLTDYVRRVESNLTRFDFDDQTLAMNALGVRVIAGGSRPERPDLEWRVEVHLEPDQAGVLSTSSSCHRCRRSGWRSSG